MFSLGLQPLTAQPPATQPASMLRLPGPASRVVDPVAAAAAQPVSVAFDFQQFLSGTVPPSGVHAFREACRTPEVMARVGPGARVPNAMGNGMPSADLTLGRMLLRRALREDAGKLAVAQEATVGRLPLAYHADLAALAEPPAAPKPKRRAATTIEYDLEAEEGDEEECSTEHSSQEGESLGSDDTSGDDEDDDDAALISNVNSMSGESAVGEDALSSSESEFVVADSDDDDEDGSALFSCGDDDDSEEADEGADSPAPPVPRRQTRNNARINETISEIARVLDLANIDEGLSSEDEDGEPIVPGSDQEDSDSSADSAEADQDDSGDEPLLGYVDVVSDEDDAYTHKRAATPDDESAPPTPLPVRKRAASPVACDDQQDSAPSTPIVVRKREPVSDARHEHKKRAPAGPTQVEVLTAAMLFAVALREPAATRSSALYQMSNGAPGDDGLRDAYLEMMDQVPERYEFLRFLYDQQAAVPLGPDRAAAVRALCVELAAQIPK